MYRQSRPMGWQGESARHSLSARGIFTRRQKTRTDCSPVVTPGKTFVDIIRRIFGVKNIKYSSDGVYFEYFGDQIELRGLECTRRGTVAEVLLVNGSVRDFTVVPAVFFDPSYLDRIIRG